MRFLFYYLCENVIDCFFKVTLFKKQLSSQKCSSHNMERPFGKWTKLFRKKIKYKYTEHKLEQQNICLKHQLKNSNRNQTYSYFK